MGILEHTLEKLWHEIDGKKQEITFTVTGPLVYRTELYFQNTDIFNDVAR